MHFIDGEFQIGCFTDKTFRSANNTRASKKEQTSDKHVKESSARMNKAFIVRTASWAKLLHGHGKSLRVWRNFLFCLNLLQPWHKSYFWNVPGLPLPAINWSGRSLTGGKALPRRSRPDASVSVYCDSGCCRVTHRRDDTEPGPGVRAESALFADRRWRVHAAGDGGGGLGGVFFVRSEECDARTGSRLASTVSPGGDKAVGAQRKREEASSAAKWGGTKLKPGQAEGQKSHCLVLLCCDLSSFILTSNLLSPVFKKRPIYLLPCP